MNQAINLIDEMIQDYNNYEKDWVLHDSDRIRLGLLRNLKEKFSSLSSDTQWIDTLQRYDCWMLNYDECDMKKSDTGGYVKYSDLVDLLRS